MFSNDTLIQALMKSWCGICGQLRFDNQAVKSQDLEIMRQKIARRGPDDSGITYSRSYFSSSL
jgi:asparagine synthetase B (glutamine-hydrolysing)